MDEIPKPTTTRKITRRQLFDELYEECKSLKKREREKYIYDRMKQYFANTEAAKQYVDSQFDRLKRNAIAKRVRLARLLQYLPPNARTLFVCRRFYLVSVCFCLL